MMLNKVGPIFFSLHDRFVIRLRKKQFRLYVCKEE